MATFAIGDIHGCYDAMLSVLRLANVSETDRVVWLGDYVDRGPDSAKVIQYLSQLSVDSNICLKGNHEIMMRNAKGSLKSMRAWAPFGGGATWDSYIREYGGTNGLEAVPEAHWTFLDNLKPYYESETHIFVHAAVEADLELNDQPAETFYWGVFESIGPHISGKHVICGHRSQKDGIPKTNANATCIDTWACGAGWLTCLNVESRQYFQTNQSGDAQTGWLNDTV